MWYVVIRHRLLHRRGTVAAEWAAADSDHGWHPTAPSADIATRRADRLVQFAASSAILQAPPDHWYVPAPPDCRVTARVAQSVRYWAVPEDRSESGSADRRPNAG